VTCRSSPTPTSTGGAPARPSRSTSQPAAASTWCLAAARPVKLAMVAPVTKPQEALAGRPSSSASQPAAACSAAAAAGDITNRPAFWSQAETSQRRLRITVTSGLVAFRDHVVLVMRKRLWSAPRAAGRLPPITKPK
jgi:hypothetical protein